MNFIQDQSRQKLRGGYYTPLDLAAFLASWVLESNPARILEPSCGDGVLFAALAQCKVKSSTEIVAFEIDEGEAAKSRERARESSLEKISVHATDFLGWALENLHNSSAHFDSVVGNPPFVRYQYLPQNFQTRAEQIFKSLGLPFTKHTNAWVPFILASMALLRPGGRLAMVVPSEIVHIAHAQSLRSYLGFQCSRLVIIDPEHIWFDNTLQGAVILMAEKKIDIDTPSHGLGIYPTRNREFLARPPSDIFRQPKCMNGKTVEGKWTRALLSPQVRDLIDELDIHKDVYKFDNIAKVDVGIVTGANKFFLVTDHTVREHKLGQWAHPMFGRSEHCPGIIYDETQHEQNAKEGKPTNFLWFQSTLTSEAREYIESGERQNLDGRYKCRVRTPWYTVPSVYATEIGMLKRAHDAPRLILNKIKAFTTDTSYRIRSFRFSPEVLVASFVNPLTALSAELEGRHYGGGVLELVPSEIERLRIPIVDQACLDVARVDELVRSCSADEAISRQGAIILGAIGLSDQDQGSLFDAWRQLRNRRHRCPSELSDRED